MASFPASVEAWRPLIQRYVPSPAGGIDFWLAWIQRESGGNPCSYTSLRESGLFQLMPPDNTAKGGTTEAALRTACSGSTRTRSLSEAEVREQILSFDRYLRYITGRARDKLASVGASWNESSPDFWQLVKFQHTLPAPTVPWLQAAKAGIGRAPANWTELGPYAGAAGIPAKWVENARWVGSFGGGVQIPLVIAAIAGGSLLMYYLWRKRR